MYRVEIIMLPDGSAVYDIVGTPSNERTERVVASTLDHVEADAVCEELNRMLESVEELERRFLPVPNVRALHVPALMQ